MRAIDRIQKTFTLAALLTMMSSVQAFPPAPHHLIYGLVRDELGNPLTAEDAELIFETPSGIKLTSAIRFGDEPGRNYQIAAPMDSGITSDAYMPTALHPAAPFKIRVRIGGTVYLPIEMSGDYASLGLPGKKTRLNLTLGVDSDGDGLPDAWERNLIAALRLNQSIADITPGIDSDGDGMNNGDEYFAGTYAFDKQDGYDLTIKATQGNAATLEFMGIRGRTYSIHASPDLVHWTQIPFKVGSGANALTWRAADVRAVQAEVENATGSEAFRFFKLMIQ